MIQKIYGDYLWISSLDKLFVEEYREKFDSYLENTNSIETSSWGQCKVESSYFNNVFIKNHQEIDFDSMFSDMLFNEIELFCKELNINEYNKDSLKIQHIWFNQYFFGDFQENHNHSGERATFSFVYILKNSQSNLDSKLCFGNPRSNLFRCNNFEQLFNIDEYKAVFIPDLNNGDLIIFPSHMDHYVSVHKNKDVNRITISGNIDFL